MTWLQKFDRALQFLLLLIMVLVIGALVSHCATFKSVARTVDDAASILCELFATEHQAEVKLTPKEFCDIKENFQPFLDQVLAAQRTAGGEVGTRLGLDGKP